MKRINTQLHTERNRYPYLYGNAYHLRNKYRGSTVKILSFGCSAGDELLTLSEYFPNDMIYGCDINTDVLAVAREKAECDRIRVFESNQANLESIGPFDLIFANSVLCINAPNPSLLKSNFPFAEFEELILQLAALLTTDGILCIFNASYFPDDSEKFLAMVKPVRSHFVSMGYVPRFDRNSNLLLERKVVENKGYYVVKSPDNISFEAVANVIFTRSDNIAREKLDYSMFDSWRDINGMFIPQELKSISGSVVWEKSIWHYRGGKKEPDVKITHERVARIGREFLPQIFYKLPHSANGFKALSDY